jgi:hypothetical protein
MRLSILPSIRSWFAWIHGARYLSPGYIWTGVDFPLLTSTHQEVECVDRGVPYVTHRELRPLAAVPIAATAASTC